MFGSIKAGLISTGIGAFIVAIGSLVSYFTQTKKGAELLETALAGVGAAAGVIVDRISTFGGAIVKLFKGDAKGALEGVKATFKDIIFHMCTLWPNRFQPRNGVANRLVSSFSR